MIVILLVLILLVLLFGAGAVRSGLGKLAIILGGGFLLLLVGGWTSALIGDAGYWIAFAAIFILASVTLSSATR